MTESNYWVGTYVSPSSHDRSTIEPRFITKPFISAPFQPPVQEGDGNDSDGILDDVVVLESDRARGFPPAMESNFRHL